MAIPIAGPLPDNDADRQAVLTMAEVASVAGYMARVGREARALQGAMPGPLPTLGLAPSPPHQGPRLERSPF